jgi:hypothetical protein
MANGVGADGARPVARSRERKTRVFISYSRTDSAFADQLLAALNAHEFDAYLDKKDILPGEPRKERLGALILSADAVVFIISPESMASDICTWEIDETERLQKKLLPVVHRQLADKQVPFRLARLHYIFLRAEDKFDLGLATLAAAIETDVGWIRHHTRISELARRWEDGKHRDQGLLRGEDIAEAERWRDSHPKGAPAATKEQLVFITASRQAATRRQRYAIGGSVAITVIALGLAGLAYWQRELAIKNEARAVANETLAKKNEDLATRQAKIALAGQLAAQSEVAYSQQGHLLERGVLLAIESARWAQGLSLDTNLALRRGLDLLPAAVVEVPQKESIFNLVVSPDGAHAATASGTTVEIWEVATGRIVSRLPHAETVFGRLVVPSYTTALFAPKCQSFVGNVLAKVGPLSIME